MAELAGFDRSRFLLRHDGGTALQRKDQVFGMELELFESDFFELFIFGEKRLLNQIVEPLSVTAVFGMQAADFLAQRILYFIHRRLLDLCEHFHIAPFGEKLQVGRAGESKCPVEFSCVAGCLGI